MSVGFDMSAWGASWWTAAGIICMILLGVLVFRVWRRNKKKK